MASRESFFLSKSKGSCVPAFVLCWCKKIVGDIRRFLATGYDRTWCEHGSNRGGQVGEQSQISRSWKGRMGKVLSG